MFNYHNVGRCDVQVQVQPKDDLQKTKENSANQRLLAAWSHEGCKPHDRTSSDITGFKQIYITLGKHSAERNQSVLL